jgi:hypothetical protein
LPTTGEKLTLSVVEFRLCQDALLFQQSAEGGHPMVIIVRGIRWSVGARPIGDSVD